ncbi:MAG: monovalent cation/H+ antiporter subunit D [Burkholderiaceae bacterium]
MSWPHWIIVPIVLPLMTGALLVLLERNRAVWVRPISLFSLGFLLMVCIGLTMHAAQGQVEGYLLSNWKAPFGIALALDRLSAMLLLLTALVATISLLYASGGDDARGPHFHALFHFQLMGINGAFLTADLFNLFVFFEVLLAASYGLLLHGAGKARVKASVHYVVFNLTGGALFLIAVSLLYGLTGTLNMADLAVKVPQLPPDKALLAQTAGLLLLVVFAVKAALLPLYFWLPNTYGAATAPVAALFAIMTKVGIYAIARMYTLVFGDAGGAAANLAQPFLPLLAMGTLALAAVGALAATRARALVGYIIIASAGTLLLALGLNSAQTVGAGLFYLVNSTLIAALLFLIADRVLSARASANDLLVPGDIAERMRWAVWFFIAAIAACGLPPLAGFLGKAMLLKAALVTPYAAWVWAVVLIAGLTMTVAMARAGSALFWKTDEGAVAAYGSRAEQSAAMPLHAVHTKAMALAATAAVACVVFAGPLAAYTQAAANQLFERQAYINAVLNKEPAPPMFDVRKEMREWKDKEAGK